MRQLHVTVWSFTFEFKLEAIQWYHDDIESKHVTFDIDSKWVHEWVLKKDERAD